MTGPSADRVVLAHTLFANQTNPLIGMVKPIAEIVDDELVPITQANFCHTLKVFITSHYDELEKRFPDQQLFKLRVSPNFKRSEISKTQRLLRNYRCSAARFRLSLHLPCCWRSVDALCIRK